MNSVNHLRGHVKNMQLIKWFLAGSWAFEGQGSFRSTTENLPSDGPGERAATLATTPHETGFMGTPGFASFTQ